MRVGIYKSKRAREQALSLLKHIRKACKEEVFLVEIEPAIRTYEDEFIQLYSALQNDEIDVAIMDGTKYIRGEYSSEQCLIENLRVVGSGKRMNAENVLVVPKKYDKKKQEDQSQPISVWTNDVIFQKQMESISEGVECQYTHNRMSKMMHMLIEGECDGVVMSTSDAKRLNLHKHKKLQIIAYDVQSFVPLYGQGLVISFMRTDAMGIEKKIQLEQYQEAIKRASYIESFHEFYIEHTIIQKIHTKINTFLKENCNYVIEVSDLCVHAEILGMDLKVSVFIYLSENQFIKFALQGPLEEKNRIVHEIIQQIQKKIIYS